MNSNQEWDSLTLYVLNWHRWNTLQKQRPPKKENMNLVKCSHIITMHHLNLNQDDLTGMQDMDQQATSCHLVAP